MESLPDMATTGPSGVTSGCKWRGSRSKDQIDQGFQLLQRSVHLLETRRTFHGGGFASRQVTNNSSENEETLMMNNNNIGKGNWSWQQ